MEVFYDRLFEAMDRTNEADQRGQPLPSQPVTGVTAIHRHMQSYALTESMNGFKRMQLCRQALEALDRRGWNRSFHQRLFHEEYLKSCTRVFFKRDGPGAFARPVPPPPSQRAVLTFGQQGAQQDPGAQLVGLHAARDPCQYSQALWQDHLCVHVCSRHDGGLPQYGAVHL